MIDLVNEIQIVVRLQSVLGHQSAHRGAVALVIILLHAKGLIRRYLQEILDIGADAVVHLLPEIEVMRIERIVEIEHPGLDVAETARRGTLAGLHDYWSLKRTVVAAWPPISIAAKPAEVRPRAAQSLWLLNSNLPSRTQSMTLPPHFTGAPSRNSAWPVSSTASA